MFAKFYLTTRSLGDAMDPQLQAKLLYCTMADVMLLSTKHSLSLREAVILLLVFHLDGSCRVKLMCNTLEIPHNTASTHIRRLIQKGFAIRTMCKQDARSHIITLTSKGKNLAKKFTDAVQDYF